MALYWRFVEKPRVSYEVGRRFILAMQQHADSGAKTQPRNLDLQARRAAKGPRSRPSPVSVVLAIAQIPGRQGTEIRPRARKTKSLRSEQSRTPLQTYIDHISRWAGCLWFGVIFNPLELFTFGGEEGMPVISAALAHRKKKTDLAYLNTYQLLTHLQTTESIERRLEDPKNFFCRCNMLLDPCHC